MTKKESKLGAPDRLVKASPEGAVELTEQELDLVSAADGKTKTTTTTTTKTDKEPYLVVTIKDVLIS